MVPVVLVVLVVVKVVVVVVGGVVPYRPAGVACQSVRPPETRTERNDKWWNDALKESHWFLFHRCYAAVVGPLSEALNCSECNCIGNVKPLTCGQFIIQIFGITNGCEQNDHQHEV